jgi:hypothetical protein
MKQDRTTMPAGTKKAAVEEAFKLLIDTHAQVAIRRLRGKVQWEGDLHQSRRGRRRT